jgi:hypothetical protein
MSRPITRFARGASSQRDRARPAAEIEHHYVGYKPVNEFTAPH